MLYWFALVVALWLTTGPALGAPVSGTKPKKAATTDEKKKGAAMDSHTVRRGETLWGIARLHGVSVGDIMDLNRLSDSTLRDGQVLKIPSLGSDPALVPSTPTTHVVAKGENFRGIARKYGLTQEDLERANPKTNPAAPQTGSKLTIPATVSVTESPDPPASKDAAGPTPAAQGIQPVDDTPKDDIPRIGIPKIGMARTDSTKTDPPKTDAPKRTVAAPVTQDTAGKASSSGKEDTKAKLKLKTRRYVVSDDEAPQTISEAFNITVSRLYEINGIKPGSPMRTGMEIQVPSSPGTAP